MIHNFTLLDNPIRGVSSQISFENTTFLNFIIQDQSFYLLDILESTLSVINSTSIIFRARNSQITADGITYNDIKGFRELVAISN